MQKLLHKFTNIFQGPKGLPPKRQHDHRIILKPGSILVNVRPYRYVVTQKNITKEIVMDMLQTGVIKPSSSPYANSIVLLMKKKKDNSWRMCIDYKRFNAIIVKNKFPTPLIIEFLEELSSFPRLTWSWVLAGQTHEEDISKTAFRTHKGHYEFVVMSFGLTNVLVAFT